MYIIDLMKYDPRRNPLGNIQTAFLPSFNPDDYEATRRQVIDATERSEGVGFVCDVRNTGDDESFLASQGFYHRLKFCSLDGRILFVGYRDPSWF